MAVQYAFSQITTQGLKLAVDAADPLSYPGSGTVLTDVTGNGYTGTVSSSISFVVTNRGGLYSANSSSAITFAGSAADFGTGSFTLEMGFTPLEINGQHFLYSKNSGSFPNFGAYLTGSNGSGRLVAFYNISSTISCSASTPTGSFITGSNYIVDVTYVPSQLATFIYTNSNISAQAGANGTGSLSTSASLFLLNNSTSSNAGSVANLYNFKVYNPNLGLSFIRKNYNAQAARFGLPLATYIPPAPLLLDTYPGAAAAYSLRKLRELYAGAAIRVRRSSDNTEADIGFDSNGELDTATLLDFCGNGNGFVKTWYDQSDNGNNATQSTAANQPQIVSGGSVILENGKPSVQFDGSNDYLFTTNLPFVFPTTAILISTAVNINVNYLFDTFIPGQNINTNRMALRYRTENGGIFAIIDQNGELKLTTNTYTANNQFLNFINFDNPNTNIYTNNLNQDTVATTYVNNTRTFNIGTFSGANNVFHDGTIQEIILYPSDQSPNRTDIETNINLFYSIY